MAPIQCVDVPESIDSCAAQELSAGRRHFAQQESGFYTAEQPLSVDGLAWARRRKVLGADGARTATFKCETTNEYGKR